MNGECGLTKSLILAKHCSEKCLEDQDCNPQYAYNIAVTLFELGLEWYEGVLEIPGHSPIPKSLFWANQVLEGDSPTELISTIESRAKTHCTNCRSRRNAGCFSEPLKRWYNV